MLLQSDNETLGEVVVKVERSDVVNARNGWVKKYGNVACSEHWLISCACHKPPISLLQQAQPTLPQSMSSHLGLSSSSEDTLLVPVDPSHAWDRREICEVPDLLPDDGLDPIKDPVVHLIIFLLKLLAPGTGRDRMQTALGICAILCHDERFGEAALPFFELVFEVFFRQTQVTSIGVPAIVSVDRDEIEEVSNCIIMRRGQSLVCERDRSVVQRPSKFDERFEVR